VWQCLFTGVTSPQMTDCCCYCSNSYAGVQTCMIHTSQPRRCSSWCITRSYRQRPLHHRLATLPLPPLVIHPAPPHTPDHSPTSCHT
jgi:hypothetical protein